MLGSRWQTDGNMPKATGGAKPMDRDSPALGPADSRGAEKAEDCEGRASRTQP